MIARARFRCERVVSPKSGTIARGRGARGLCCGLGFGVAACLLAASLPFASAFAQTAAQTPAQLATQAPAQPAVQAPAQITAEAAADAAAQPAPAPAKGKHKQNAKQREKDAAAADDAYLQGAKLVERKDFAGAQLAFERASALAPGNSDYRMAAASMLESRVTQFVQQAGKDRLLGKDAEADQLLAQAKALDPDNQLVKEHAVPGSLKDLSGMHSWITDGPRLAGPIELKPLDGVKSFHFHSDLRDAIRNVARAYGLQASFDESVRPVQVKFDLDDVSYTQAMRVLMEMGSLFAVPMSPTDVLFARDTTAKRTELDHLVQETIYLPGMTATQMAEIGNMIRQVFEIKQINVANSFNTIVVRAPTEPIRVLNLTLADMLDGGSQVVFDLKVYTIDKSYTRNVGVTPPNSAGLYSAASQAAQLVSANQSIVDQAIASGVIPASASPVEIALFLVEEGLASSTQISGTVLFVGTSGIFASGIFAPSSTALSTQLNLALNSSDTRELDDITLRVGDRENATFQVGEKYPITQATYSTTTPTSTSGLAGASIGGVSVSSLLNSATTATIPQIQYEDIGLTLKATPTVQKSGRITLHLDMKMESLQGTSISGIPILNSTVFTSDVTVEDGATATLASNLSRSESAAVTGIPGLSDLPGFQSSPELVRMTDDSQLLILLTPHLVRRRPNEWAGPRIPITRPMSVE
jgi:general secretion pathway protein D